MIPWTTVSRDAEKKERIYWLFFRFINYKVDTILDWLVANR